MQFLLIVVIALVALGVVAAIFSMDGKGELIVTKEGDCASCSSRSDCKLVELKEDVKRKKEDRRKKVEERCTHSLPSAVLFILLTSSLLLLGGCSTKKNTAKSRWWQSFTARYNTYFNGRLSLKAIWRRKTATKTTIPS